MEGTQLTFYLQENLRHEGQPAHAWLVDAARALGLPGCSVFRASGGYGHHHQWHDQGFVELQGTLPMAVVFVLSGDDASRLLAHVGAAGLRLFHVQVRASFGFTTG